jgi:NhaA family Na+:H+ antiporter
MPVRRLLDRLPLSERGFVLSALRDETVGGALLLVAAVVALAWANSPWADGYERMCDAVVGPEALHLDLSIRTWAADGLLAIFFFVAGLELKRELVVGQLRNLSEAVLPVVAAICGIALPAIIYLLVAWDDEDALRGWAVPTATDIAFALGVLAVIGSALPIALRAFLLTLAVVDDLFAILIIAFFFTSGLEHLPLLAALALLAIFALLQRHRMRAWWIYVPLAIATWALVHESGVHATVAGVALGLLTRTRHDTNEDESPAERLEHRVRPLSAGLAVPIFALTAAGVPIAAGSLTAAVGDPAAIGVVAGLVLGKSLGVFGGTYLTARFTRAELSAHIRWADIFGMSVLAGIGFTVSLLISDLAFGHDPERAEHVKAAVLVGSLVSAVVASVLLRLRSRRYQQLSDVDERDDDADGIPDAY